jgi:hypothetical protein
MAAELLLLLLAGAGISGIGGALWARRTQQAHVGHVRTDWVRAGRIIRYGPVGAISFGTRPRRTYTGGVFGALGITDQALVFDGHRSNRHDASIRLSTIRWAGLTTVPVAVGRISASKHALALHYEGSDGWRVATFVTEAPEAIAQAVSRETGLPARDTGSERADFGPVRATRLFQDVYGDWSTDREDELYLAPDRLLFAWRDAIPLDDIQRLDVIDAGRLDALNPLSSGLLRVEYRAPDDTIDVVGFRVRRGAQWADAIAERSASGLPVVQGRKKKPNS